MRKGSARPCACWMHGQRKDAWQRSIAAATARRRHCRRRAVARPASLRRSLTSDASYAGPVDQRCPALPGAFVNRQYRGALTTAVAGKATENVVRDYLRGSAGAMLACRPQTLMIRTCWADSAGGYSGMRMLRVEQRVNGRPVFQSESRFTAGS